MQKFIFLVDETRRTASLILLLDLKPNSICRIEYDFTTTWPKWNEVISKFSNENFIIVGLRLFFHLLRISTSCISRLVSSLF